MPRLTGLEECVHTVPTRPIVTHKPHLPLALYPQHLSQKVLMPFSPDTAFGQSRCNAATQFHGKLWVLVQNVGTGVIKWLAPEAQGRAAQATLPLSATRNCRIPGLSLRLLKMIHDSMNSFTTKYLRPAQGQGLRSTGE